MPANPEAVTWAVGVQQLTSVKDANGQITQAWNIPFTLSNGVTDSVTVPFADYTVDNVRKAIAALAAVHAGVSGLTGTVEGG